MGLIIRKRLRIDSSYEFVTLELFTIDECLSYVNLHVNEKYIAFNKDTIFYLENAIDSNIKISFKIFHRKIKELTGGYKSKFQYLFWINRGYTHDEAVEFVKNIQSKNSNKFINKRNKNPEQYTAYNTNQIGYWLKKGYTECQAKEMVKERQQTFSLNKCITKYGKEDGIVRFNERNTKWLDSRKSSLSKGVWNLSDQGLSFDNYVSRYGDNWLTHFIDHLYGRGRSQSYINICINVNKNKCDLLTYVLNLSYNIAKLYFICGPVNFILNKNSLELKELWCIHNNVKFITTKYGNISYVNGNFYQSTGEYEIGMYLEENKVKFDVHVPYPNSKRICDFYLEEYDMYIEYTGMGESNYKDKKIELTDHNIIWSKNINYIKEKINEKIRRD